MLSQLKKFQQRIRPYASSRNYCPSGLAVTPSEMVRLSEEGIPISSQVLSPENFNDGDMSMQVNLEPIYMRGVTVNDLYEMSRQSKVKLQKARDTVVKLCN